MLHTNKLGPIELIFSELHPFSRREHTEKGAIGLPVEGIVRPTVNVDPVVSRTDKPNTLAGGKDKIRNQTHRVA